MVDTGCTFVGNRFPSCSMVNKFALFQLPHFLVPVSSIGSAGLRCRARKRVAQTWLTQEMCRSKNLSDHDCAQKPNCRHADESGAGGTCGEY
jgi:hypothetical protein